MTTFNQLPQRFWDKIELGEGGCWIWVGARTGREGYGNFFWEKRVQYAHRVSYSILVGPIPEGLTIDHLCRVHACVRPDHLEPVTHRENLQRGSQATSIYCPNGHPYTEKNTYIPPDDRNRKCKTCMRDKQRRYRASLKA